MFRFVLSFLLILSPLSSVRAAAGISASGAVAAEKTARHPDSADENNDDDDGGVISLTPLQVVVVARKMLDLNRLHAAKVLLTRASFPSSEIETERRYLLGVLALKENRIDDAVDIWRELLNDNPRLTKVRFELALAYMAQKSWYRADYHLRLAAAEKLPPGFDRQIDALRYVARQNKNWNVWFTAGAAPDDNVNNSQTGTQCLMTPFGVLCNRLNDPEKAVGFNVGGGGNYEFRFDEHWRLRVAADLFSTTYRHHDEYDDLYWSVSAGPKYVWNRGEIWTAAKIGRRRYAHAPYNATIGGVLNVGYDWSRRLSVYLNTEYAAVSYKRNADILDGETRRVAGRAVYGINSAMYAVLRASFDREKTESEIYSNRRYTIGAGLGAELPLGFSVYAEPSVQWVRYDAPSYYVKDYRFQKIREKDRIHRYLLRLSNKNLSARGFTPEIDIAYTYKNQQSGKRNITN